MGWESRGRKRLEALLSGHGKRAALARAIGVDAGTVTRWLAAEYPPNADQIEAICKHLGVSADKLLGLEPEAQSLEEIEHRLQMLARESQALTQLLVRRAKR